MHYNSNLTQFLETRLFIEKNGYEIRNDTSVKSHLRSSYIFSLFSLSQTLHNFGLGRKCLRIMEENFLLKNNLPYCQTLLKTFPTRLLTTFAVLCLFCEALKIILHRPKSYICEGDLFANHILKLPKD